MSNIKPTQSQAARQADPTQQSAAPSKTQVGTAQAKTSIEKYQESAEAAGAGKLEVPSLAPPAPGTEKQRQDFMEFLASCGNFVAVINSYIGRLMHDTAKLELASTLQSLESTKEQGKALDKKIDADITKARIGIKAQQDERKNLTDYMNKLIGLTVTSTAIGAVGFGTAMFGATNDTSRQIINAATQQGMGQIQQGGQMAGVAKDINKTTIEARRLAGEAQAQAASDVFNFVKEVAARRGQTQDQAVQQFQQWISELNQMLQKLAQNQQSSTPFRS